MPEPTIAIVDIVFCGFLVRAAPFRSALGELTTARNPIKAPASGSNVQFEASGRPAEFLNFGRQCCINPCMRPTIPPRHLALFLSLISAMAIGSRGSTVCCGVPGAKNTSTPSVRPTLSFIAACWKASGSSKGKCLCSQRRQMPWKSPSARPIAATCPLAANRFQWDGAVEFGSSRLEPRELNPSPFAMPRGELCRSRCESPRTALRCRFLFALMMSATRSIRSCCLRRPGCFPASGMSLV